MGAAIFSFAASPAPSVLAQGVDVSVCGVVEEYTPPTTRTSGSVTVDGDSFALAPGAELPEAIRAGSNRCLVFTFDDSGRIASVSNGSGTVGSIPEASTNEDDYPGTDTNAPEPEGDTDDESAVGDGNAVVAAIGPGGAEAVDSIVTQGEDLPRTGGSAPTGGLFSLVSLAAAMLAGLGTFVLRRDA